jgi:hypothetical protein
MQIENTVTGPGCVESQNPLADFYRCPADFVAFDPPGETASHPGYFTFGPDALLYGTSTANAPSTFHGQALPDLSDQVRCWGSERALPFDLAQIVDNLRLERYIPKALNGFREVLATSAARDVYYLLRPYLPEAVRKVVQRAYFGNWKKLEFPKWPVDTTVENLMERVLCLSMRGRGLDKIPFIWFWPNGASSAAMVTHDVETTKGLDFIPRLLDVNEEFGVQASFQLVPKERYRTPQSLIDEVRRRNCEINVHGLDHDGNLFRDRKTFLRQATHINRYMNEFGAAGFRSTCMYRNTDWYKDLAISYDMSIPSVAHLEPQRGGCCTVFPYFIGNILELPLTTTQDYSLFHILGDYSIQLWREQIELIMRRNGLISFVVHPDYIQSDKALPVYRALLGHLSNLRQQKNVWIARPGEINTWWRERNALKLLPRDGGWTIEGRGSERARLAFASIKDDKVVYTMADAPDAGIFSAPNPVVDSSSQVLTDAPWRA